jgi:polyisoprenoid-binding protein YceI
MSLRTCIAALAVALAAPALAADTLELDPAHTHASFVIKHLLISNVRGEFRKTTGKVVYDEADPSKSTVEAIIDATTVDTREAKRDEHLRSPDFFDTAKFPTITFKSTKVEKAGDGKLKVSGDLTMKGVTKAVVLEVAGPTQEIKDPKGVPRRGASISTKVNRRDFGVSYGPPAVLGDEVTIEIETELLKKS